MSQRQVIYREGDQVLYQPDGRIYTIRTIGRNHQGEPVALLETKVERVPFKMLAPAPRQQQ